MLLASAFARGHDPRAAGHLDRALELAEPEGFRHTVLSIDPAIVPLLVSAVGRYRSQYAAELAGTPAPDRSTGSDRSPRVRLRPAEERIVYYLPSGLDSTELAHHLGVSKNTVKWRTSGDRGDADPSERDVAWAFSDSRTLLTLFGLLDVDGDWGDRRYHLTPAGETTMLAMLGATATGPRERPW